MKIIYTGGLPSITAGIAGQFKQNEPKEVDEAVAALLLKKADFKELKPRKKEEITDKGE